MQLSREELEDPYPVGRLELDAEGWEAGASNVPDEFEGVGLNL